MEYLAKAFHAGVTYEAYVSVEGNGDELDAEFTTLVCFVNDTAKLLDEVASEVIQLMLLDNACDQYVAECYA